MKEKGLAPVLLKWQQNVSKRVATFEKKGDI